MSSSSSPSAYFLVAHGSRDPRPQVALDRLATLVGQTLEQQTSARSLVGTGVLEFAEPLEQQIAQFALKAQMQGCQQVCLVPLFLLPGVHVQRDLPEAMEQAQRQVPATVQLQQLPHLGSQAGMLDLLAEQLETQPQDQWIFLAHGSRLSAGNQAIATLAAQLNTVPAYWFVPPLLPDRLAELVQQQHRQIGILPYFLFAGTTTDAIAQQVEELQQQYPQVRLTLASSLEPTPALARVIVNLMTQPLSLPVGS